MRVRQAAGGDVVAAVNRAVKKTGTRCGMKVQYETRKRALASAARGLLKRAKKLYVYKCPLCRSFHLTSQPQ